MKLKRLLAIGLLALAVGFQTQSYSGYEINPLGKGVPDKVILPY